MSCLRIRREHTTTHHSTRERKRQRDYLYKPDLESDIPQSSVLKKEIKLKGANSLISFCVADMRGFDLEQNICSVGYGSSREGVPLMRADSLNRFKILH